MTSTPTTSRLDPNPGLTFFLFAASLSLLVTPRPILAQGAGAFTVCDGTYALCAAAPCRPIPEADENGLAVEPTEAICDCVMATGPNVGPDTCDARAAGVADGLPISTYAFALMATHPSMTCTAGAYTDCYGYPCTVDERDPTRATCTCAIVPNEANEPFVTQGGDCDTDTCTTTLWSAATVAADLVANQALAEAAGLDETPSNWCPATVEAAESTSTCIDYCYQVMGEPGVCVGEFAIYRSLPECFETCGGFPTTGVTGAVSGDSLECRIEHAILAQGPEGPAKHCPHAAPGGGGVCVDRSPCEAYCLFYYDRVEEGECPKLERLWGDDIGSIGEDNVFHPNPGCMETCATFAGAGDSWEMSGDSANCRMQYYLMAHRRGPESGNHDQAQLDSLCRNANPIDSPMCQGSTFGDYYKTRETDPCKEFCYNDRLTCGASYGSEEACMATCAAFPAVGERQSLQGDTVQCRLSWAQYAFFVEGAQREMFCGFAAEDSLVCREPGDLGFGAALPAELQKALMGH